MRGNLLLRIAPNDSSGSGIARCAPLNGEPESRWGSSVGEGGREEWMVQNIGRDIASGSMVRPHTKSFEEPSGLSLKFIYLYLLLAEKNRTKNEKKTS